MVCQASSSLSLDQLACVPRTQGCRGLNPVVWTLLDQIWTSKGRFRASVGFREPPLISAKCLNNMGFEK